MNNLNDADARHKLREGVPRHRLFHFVRVFEQRVSRGDARENEAANCKSREENVPRSLVEDIRKGGEVGGTARALQKPEACAM